jgi:pantoate--beta-alanine ligase
MFIFKTIAELQNHLNIAGRQKKTGFVPTMGALHEGHLLLVRESKDKDLYTICSIYVNPTQFNNASDLEKYPVSIENDTRLLAEAGCDVLFIPSSREMYGTDVKADTFNYGTITGNYEGEKRPGHFDGVITIVKKLFDAVTPDEVFFGQKDLQQCMVINHLIKLEYPHLLFNMVPTHREENGLAASSRNRRLTIDQKNEAAAIYAALLHAKELIRHNTPPEQALETVIRQHLQSPLFRIEYFDFINASTMQKAPNMSPGGNYALVIACWCADVRLIDNVMLTD